MMNISQINEMIKIHNARKTDIVSEKDLRKRKRMSSKWRKEYDRLHNAKSMILHPNGEKILLSAKEECEKKMKIIEDRWEESKKIFVGKKSDIKRRKEEHHRGYGYQEMKNKLKEINFILNQ